VESDIHQYYKCAVKFVIHPKAIITKIFYLSKVEWRRKFTSA